MLKRLVGKDAVPWPILIRLTFHSSWERSERKPADSFSIPLEDNEERNDEDYLFVVPT